MDQINILFIKSTEFQRLRSSQGGRSTTAGPPFQPAGQLDLKTKEEGKDGTVVDGTQVDHEDPELRSGHGRYSRFRMLVGF